MSRGIGIKTQFDSKGWSPSSCAYYNISILPEIKVNQVKRMEGKVHGVGGTAYAEHRGGRELEVSEEVKGGQGDWGCRWAERMRWGWRGTGPGHAGPGRSWQTLALLNRKQLEGSKREWIWSDLSFEMVALVIAHLVIVLRGRQRQIWGGNWKAFGGGWGLRAMVLNWVLTSDFSNPVDNDTIFLRREQWEMIFGEKGTEFDLGRLCVRCLWDTQVELFSTLFYI